MSPQDKSPPPRRFPLLKVLLIVTGGLLIWYLFVAVQPERLPYGLFVELVKAGHVLDARVGQTTIRGHFNRKAAAPILEEWRQRVEMLSGKGEEPPAGTEPGTRPVDAPPGDGSPGEAAPGDTPPDTVPPGEEPREETAPGEPPAEQTPPAPLPPPRIAPFSEVSETSYPYAVTRGGLRDDEMLSKLLLEHDILVSQEHESNLFVHILILAAMLAIFVGLGIFMLRRTDAYGQQVLTFGKSRAKIVAVSDTKTTFEDVAGCEEAKEELAEVVAFLRDPGRFERLGGSVPKGMLLVGPPGTGKTLMARAIAGEAQVPFFSISGSDFVEMFVGVGAARVRDLFLQAKGKAPCIIFIDEIDAVGRQRGAGLGGGNDEREQTLNQLLSELDGFEPNSGVIVIAATNRPDVLDPALLRPGRFDRQVVIDNADVVGRAKILSVHSRGKPLADDVDLEELARRTPGFSGADLANVMNEAALLAARRGKEVISRAETEEAVERVMAGPERRSRVIRPHEKKIIAYHETGHALVSFYCPRADRVQKISIVPRGHAALGYTLQLPSEDRYIRQRAELVDRICCLLGGRIAEELVFGDSSTGAADDLEKVTDLARSIICRYGMSEELGPLTYQRDDQEVFLGRQFREDSTRYSNETLSSVDQEVRELVESCYERTTGILTEHRDLLDTLARELMEREVMEGHEFARIIREHRGESAPAAVGEYPTPEELERRAMERRRQAARKTAPEEQPAG